VLNSGVQNFSNLCQGEPCQIQSWMDGR